jgi:hypothetical protein
MLLGDLVMEELAQNIAFDGLALIHELLRLTVGTPSLVVRVHHCERRFEGTVRFGFPKKFDFLDTDFTRTGLRSQN